LALRIPQLRCNVYEKQLKKKRLAHGHIEMVPIPFLLEFLGKSAVAI